MFRTEIIPQKSLHKIDHHTPITMMGSCFSDKIGMRLFQNKFNVLYNPFGVIFNPISILKLLQVALKNKPLDTANWVKSEGIHLHYDTHSQLGSVNKEDATININKAINIAHHQLKKTKWLIITWGTAIVYERKDTREVVASCHKVPIDQFNRRFLTSKEIIADFEKILSILPADINILLTVSPVRHLKETLELNSVSKSILRLTCHHLSEQYAQIQYFPAYELILDDLRDYRFYKSDMLHPSDEAIDYVWEKLKQTYFDSSSIDFIEHWGKISAAINHQPFNPHSEAHQQFIKNTIKSIQALNTSIDVSKEINILEQQLIL